MISFRADKLWQFCLNLFVLDLIFVITLNLRHVLSLHGDEPPIVVCCYFKKNEIRINYFSVLPSEMDTKLVYLTQRYPHEQPKFLVLAYMLRRNFCIPVWRLICAMS